MGSAVSAVSRHYKYGLHPEKYYRKYVLPSRTGKLLNFVGLSQNNGLKLFNMFIIIDFDNSGEITRKEFRNYIKKFSTSKFAHRALETYGDNGSLTFDDFCLTMYSFCTYDEQMMSRFAFRLLDVDKTGRLLIEECDALIRMVHNISEADPKLMEVISFNCIPEQDQYFRTLRRISEDTFVQVIIAGENNLLAPAFSFQRELRDRTLGIKCWERISVRRQSIGNGDDKTSAPVLSDLHLEGMDIIMKGFSDGL